MPRPAERPLETTLQAPPSPRAESWPQPIQFERLALRSLLYLTLAVAVRGIVFGDMTAPIVAAVSIAGLACSARR